MALLYDNHYYKITNFYIDYTSSLCVIGVSIYKDKLNRDIEKETKPLIDKFVLKAHDCLKNLSDEIHNIIDTNGWNTDIAIENARKEDQYFKSLYDMYIGMSNELHKIEHELLRSSIDPSSLMFLDYWKSIGLTENMLTEIEKEGYINHRIDYMPEDISLSSLYEVLKLELIDSEDC